jgi:hypothetical protein
MGVSKIECSQPKTPKPKMRGHNTRNDVKWQGALQQNGIKQMGVKLGLHVQAFS